MPSVQGIVLDRNGSQLWFAKKGAIVEEEESKLQLSMIGQAPVLDVKCLLFTGLEPIGLQYLAFSSIVGWVMAWASKRYCRHEPATDGGIESYPVRATWPTGITWKAATLAGINRC